MFWARPVIYNQTCPYKASCSRFLARPIVTNCLCCGHTWLHDNSCTSFGHHTVYACLLCVLLCLAFQGLDKLLQMYWKGIIRSSAIHMWCMLQTSPHHCTILCWIVCGDSIVSHCCHTEYWQALFEILYCQWESQNWPGLGVFSESLGLYLLISTEPSGSIEVASIILLHYWGKLISKFEAVMNRINTWIFHYQLHYKDIAQPFWSFLGLAESVSLWYIPKVIKSISH